MFLKADKIYFNSTFWFTTPLSRHLPFPEMYSFKSELWMLEQPQGVRLIYCRDKLVYYSRALRTVVDFIKDFHSLALKKINFVCI